MIGQHILDDLQVAGLAGLPFAWQTDGTLDLSDDRLTDAQRVAIRNVFAAHDPGRRQAPRVVSMRQARLALLQSNLLEQVNAAVAAADEATKITWEFSSEVHRNHPFVATLAAALNLSEAQLDNLFTLAATL